MKLRIISAIIVSSLSSFAFAQTEYDNHAEFLKAAPGVITGVTILPASQMDLPAPLKNDLILRAQQMKTKGYIESSLPNPKNLMSIKERSPSAAPPHKADPYNFYLKKDISEIKLSFAYQSALNPSERIGFAPVGTYLKEGWTGIREFFENKEMGICSLTLYHLNSSKMAISINADQVSSLVNNKPTTIEVEGSKKTGFKYTVSWVDDAYAKDLECAKMDFDKTMQNKLVTLANNIDKI